MITIISDDGYPVAVSTTGCHDKNKCLEALKYFNDYMEEVGGGRPYVEVVNENGKRYAAPPAS